MFIALAAGGALAGPVPYVGGEWRPLSRGDLTWVDDGYTTGLTVGGLDGLVRPSLMVYGGAWISGRVGLQGSLGVARLQTTTVIEDVVTQRHWGVIRPGIDVRYALLPVGDPRPVPFLIGGMHLDLPSARDISTGYTDEEQAQADVTATSDRYRLGALGARMGAGVTLDVIDHLSVGLQYTFAWQRSLFVGNDPTTTTSLLVGEAALLIQVQWPGVDPISEPASN